MFGTSALLHCLRGKFVFSETIELLLLFVIHGFCVSLNTLGSGVCEMFTSGQLLF
jgi:hypothetical protein